MECGQGFSHRGGEPDPVGRGDLGPGLGEAHAAKLIHEEVTPPIDIADCAYARCRDGQPAVDRLENRRLRVPRGKIKRRVDLEHRHIADRVDGKGAIRIAAK